MRQLITPIYNRLGGLIPYVNKNEAADIIKFKGLVFGWACRMELPECVQNAKNMFIEWTITPQSNPLVAEINVNFNQFVCK